MTPSMCVFLSLLKKKEKKTKKKHCLYSLSDFGNFRVAVFIPRASNEKLSKLYLAFERECTTAMNFQFRFAWNAWSSPAFGPTDQRRSARTTVSGSDDFLQLTQSYSATVLSKFTASALGCSARKDTFHFVFKRRYRYTVLRDRTCSEKDTNECSCLICDSSCCRTSCVGVQPCTPKVLPNTEMFLPSRVFA